MTQTKIVVLDDDPTGSQTVHSCLLLTQWDAATLTAALLDSAPLFFVLTNTRAMNAGQAAQTTREVCRNLRRALLDLAATGVIINPLLVSRSDSTLRGHYPVETDVIAAELGPFDAHFLVPAFFEGGRTTRDSVHYLRVNGVDVPVHETEFARDSVFAYHHSYLPDYVAEKTAGRITAAQVERITRDQLRAPALGTRLEALRDNVCCVVDGETQTDLDRFAGALLAGAQQGRRYLLRSAASLLTSLARLPPQPVAATAMRAYTRDGRPGAVIVGSHVNKTTLQLTQLLRQPGITGCEIDVDGIAAQREQLLQNCLQFASRAHANGQTPVFFTSRTEKVFADQYSRLQFGMQVSAFLMDIVARLPVTLGFLISKGGITSNDVLSTGLTLQQARVLGQVLAGCSVVRCPDDHPRYPQLPVVIFPGNVGDDNALATVYCRLSGQCDDTTC